MVLILFALITLLSFLSREPGALTRAWLRLLFQVFGWGAYVVPVGIGAIGVWLIWRHFGDQLPPLDPIRISGTLLAFIALLTLMHATIESFSPLGEVYINPALNDPSQPEYSPNAVWENAVACPARPQEYLNRGWVRTQAYLGSYDLAACGHGGGYLGAFIVVTLANLLGPIATFVIAIAVLIGGGLMAARMTLKDAMGQVASGVQNVRDRRAAAGAGAPGGIRRGGKPQPEEEGEEAAKPASGRAAGKSTEEKPQPVLPGRPSIVTGKGPAGSPASPATAARAGAAPGGIASSPSAPAESKTAAPAAAGSGSPAQRPGAAPAGRPTIPPRPGTPAEEKPEESKPQTAPSPAAPSAQPGVPPARPGAPPSGGPGERPASGRPPGAPGAGSPFPRPAASPPLPGRPDPAADEDEDDDDDEPDSPAPGTPPTGGGVPGGTMRPGGPGIPGAPPGIGRPGGPPGQVRPGGPPSSPSGSLPRPGDATKPEDEEERLGTGASGRPRTFGPATPPSSLGGSPGAPRPNLPGAPAPRPGAPRPVDATLEDEDEPSSEQIIRELVEDSKGGPPRPGLPTGNSDNKPGQPTGRPGLPAGAPPRPGIPATIREPGEEPVKKEETASDARPAAPPRPGLAGQGPAASRPTPGTPAPTGPRPSGGPVSPPPTTTTQAKPPKAPEAEQKPGTPKWEMPAISLLNPAVRKVMSDEELRSRAEIIEQTLSSFGAPGRVVEVNRGPVITQFGVEPDYIDGRAGKRIKVKVGKISALADDLALVLAAPTIRIEAPVPGKGYVGIEVPNAEPAIVGLRDTMDTPEFHKLDTTLKLALGQDVSGHPVVADMTSMPHLLIAGTTGSGKSVCVNGIICTMLMTNTPDELKMIMVDPKRVELTNYNGIPHLMAPVVTELERIVGVLKWVQREMDERYRRFAVAGARNITDYNTRIDRGQIEAQEKLPYILVIVDELADLMMLAPDETERVITRLAQMARATGIHIIISTQRPSVDVVTGLIKANFPARIAFAVATGVDSRVILDTPGAEKLLGRGDMLFQAPDAPLPQRVQGVYVSDEEINSIVKFWREQAAKHGVQPNVTRLDRLTTTGGFEQPAGSGSERMAAMGGTPGGLQQRALFDANADEGDDLFDEAVELVRDMGKASISLLQRHLRIGYTRAARLIDIMEERGVIGPHEGGSKPRVVLGPDGKPLRELDEDDEDEDLDFDGEDEDDLDDEEEAQAGPALNVKPAPSGSANPGGEKKEQDTE